MKHNCIKNITLCALFTAILAVCAQIAIPAPSGISLTLQTFGVALCGVALGAGRGVLAVIAYLALGLAGAPVFSSFTGGAAVFMGPTGGFLIGFIPLCLSCGVCCYVNHKIFKIIFPAIGLLLCHALGIVVFSVISNTDLLKTVMAVSLPYMAKDIVAVAAAFYMGGKISRQINFIGKH